MSPTRVSLASGVALVLLVSGFVMATTYVPTDLGDLPGGDDESKAYGINASGQVVGDGSAATGPRGYLWSNGVMTDLGDIPGGDDESRARGINASGQVVGHSRSSLTMRGFLWENGLMTGLGDLTSYPSGWVEADAINDNGQTVGHAQLKGQGSDNHPFLWENGVMTDLGELPGAVTGGSARTEAYAINNSGQVVGRSKLPAGYRAFLWQNGTMTELGALPGGDGTSEALGINASGQIVGFCGSATGDRPVLWQNGTVSDLGDLPGGDAKGQAYGINGPGQVVGQSDSGRGWLGFVWDPNGGMRDLNQMLPADVAGGETWKIRLARGINDAGQIAAEGRVPTGQEHAILLTPVEAPVIADIADRSITEGQAYAETPTLASGDAADTWALISGPSGLAVEANTGAVSWATPITTGSPFTVTIRATNVDGSDDETWQLTVSAPAAGGPCAAAPAMVLLPLVGGLLLLRRGGPRRRR